MFDHCNLNFLWAFCWLRCIYFAFSTVTNGNAGDSEEEGIRHFMVKVIEPQFNLQSEEANVTFEPLLSWRFVNVVINSFLFFFSCGFFSYDCDLFMHLLFINILLIILCHWYSKYTRSPWVTDFYAYGGKMKPQRKLLCQGKAVWFYYILFLFFESRSNCYRVSIFMYCRFLQ